LSLILRKVREEEAQARQLPAGQAVATGHIENPVSKSANRDALPQPKARVRRWLEKVQVAWHEFQASRGRDAVYDYLRTVFTIVMHFKVRRRTKRLLRHAFEFASLRFDKSADPFASVIRCTCGGAADNKTISKWSRALRYAAIHKPPEMRLKAFMKQAGGVNECVGETAMWSAGTFSTAYSGNRDEAVEGVIEADPIAGTVRAIMAKRMEWSGTASKLLAELSREVDERVVKSKNWPDAPRALSGRLRRAATFLRKTGIEISFTKEGRAKTRIIHITTSASHVAPDNAGAQPSAPSASSAPIANSKPTNGFEGTDLRSVGDATDATKVPTVRGNPLEHNAGIVADGADANLRSKSVPEEADIWRKVI
jgi:hypothetical protein